MPKLKVLSCNELLKIFNSFGFEIFSQKGSHIKLRRIENNEKQTLVIPNHKTLDTGTCRAILRQASKYIPLGKLSPHFYSD